MKTLFVPLFTLFIISFLSSSCSKSSQSGQARLIVALTDGPGDFEAVNIDVQDVRVNYSSDEKGWISLAGVKAGTYDVLRLTNGKDTLLADARVETGRIQQIRLVLGQNNSVKFKGRTYPLQTPSGAQAGLKLNIHQDMTEGLTYKLLMDFDASRSIVQNGKGKFLLKPVIRTSLEAIGGSIRGYVLPNQFASAVYALRGTDTIAGTYTANGAYLLKGLQPGSYNLAFVPTDQTFQQQNRTGVAVVLNNITVVDTIRLVQ